MEAAPRPDTQEVDEIVLAPLDEGAWVAIRCLHRDSMRRARPQELVFIFALERTGRVISCLDEDAVVLVAGYRTTATTATTTREGAGA